MEIKTIYKIISGPLEEIEQILNLLATDDWRPVTMSSHGSPVVFTVILENKIMDEAKLSVAGAIIDDTIRETKEDIQ